MRVGSRDAFPTALHTNTLPRPNRMSVGAAPSRTDVRLEASDLRLTLSPDVLELGSRLAASALEPLMQVRCGAVG